ncbi:MAG TPA: hypothetical protein PL151_05650 [Phycisphaerae bacterium]|nr:hypothetical protein [Phycisphaerae bacterium]HOJ72340.1 hypothetical protein [Phycisphaerae bacterium]HOM49998.1 hypothetical protein [Phycisphaerae bacterium]HOQ84754.1 hypothetical protein [Phycisphaerae bacterium]HPP26426.1 hypothetical protein [Phycisphaerae bacterium]
MHHALKDVVRTPKRCFGVGQAVVIGLVALTGCHQPDPPPAAYAGPTLASADLGLVEAVETSANGFVILEPDGSQGRFPAALAVVKLEKPSPLFVYDDPLFVADRGWEIANIREEEAAYWNGLLKRIPESRSVHVLGRSNVISPDCGLDDVLEAVARLKVDLCLIYGPRMCSDVDNAALGGVILDVKTGNHLAYVQSEAGPLDFEPPRRDRSKYDRSHVDVNYLAARRFEREVRRCFMELIARDTPAASTQPSPWRYIHESRVPAGTVPVQIVPNRRTGG